MPMPCEIHPKARIFDDIGCGGCWMAKEESGIIRCEDDLPRCSTCNEIIEHKAQAQRFCKSCRAARIVAQHRRPRKKKMVHCKYCTKEFAVQMKTTKRFFCSRRCYDLDHAKAKKVQRLQEKMVSTESWLFSEMAMPLQVSA